MASLVSKLSFLFFIVLLVLSPQIQARDSKVFSLFTHFRTLYNVKEHQNLPVKPKAKSPISAPTPAPAPALEPVAAPTPEPITAPESGPAPEPEFVDNGNGYGLYGTKSSTTQDSSPNKETPMTTTTTFENELLDEDLTGESYNPSSFSNNEVYRNSNSYNNEQEFSSSSNNGYNNMNHEDSHSNNNYNNEEEFRSSYNNGYNNKNHEDSYSNNNYNERYTNNYNNGNEYKNNNYNTGNEYNSNSNNVYDEVKREGMSDTRFMENGKYYYPVKNKNNQNYNLNEYEPVRGDTEGEGYYEKNQYPNEFDTMEEYEKQQESQGYTP